MASVNGVRSSTSIYGNRNVLSGLASGLDTETLIENAISAYKNKITALQQKRTKTEWKQDAYRSIIDKMSVFSEKYTSYNSSTNLTSTSFFNQAVQTLTKGANADKITASGKTSSSVSINRVKQLATSARYAISGSAIDASLSSGDKKTSAVSSGSVNLDGPLELSTLSGSMTLAYGGSDARTYLTVNFDETQVFKDDPPGTEGGKTAAEKLVDEINKQLSEQTVVIGNTSYTGEDLLKNVIKAEANPNGVIGFTDPKKNGVYVSGASDDVKEVLLGGEEPDEAVTKLIGINRNGAKSLVDTKKDVVGYLNENAPLTITLDGVTKTVEMPSKEELLASLEEMNKKEPIPYYNELKKKIQDNEPLNSSSSRQIRDNAYANALQKKIDDAFGEGKLTVSDHMTDSADGKDKGFQFKFEAKEGSTFQIKSDKNKILGMDETTGTTSYLNTNKTLGDLLGDKLENGGFETVKVEDGKDKDGNPIYKDKLDEDGNKIYSFKVNGVEVGQYTKDTALGTIISDINSNKEVGLNASYSKTTNELVFTAKDTGEAEKIEFEGLSAALFGDPSGKNGTSIGEFTKGKDAIFSATINGKEMDLTRASNTVDLDGMSVTLKGTFGYEEVKDKDGNVTEYKEIDTEAVTFETNADADKIVDAVKAMVEDYNAMVTEIKNAYSTLPLQRSNKAYYEPLTEEDMEGMSESAIKAWEDKAKTGLLFGDSDLSQLYKRLTKSVSMYGENGADLEAAGISTSYSNGLTTLKFDEQKLRDTLNSDPDKVRDIFTKNDGLMQSMKVPLDQYGKTTGGKGILVDKAGSTLAPSTLYTNRIYKELTSIDEQIDKWQDKMTDRVDYYTQQFSRLEQLVSQMNSQSSYFAQLAGG